MIARPGHIVAALVLLAAFVVFSRAATAEEQTVRAFSAWQAEGQLLQTGPNEATFLATLSGRLYFDADQGPVDAGAIICPFVVHINLKNNTQVGSGSCAVTGPNGNKAYLELRCTGVPLVGCSGDSTLSGGTGPFDKVTGGGRFVVRSNLHELTPHPDTTIKDVFSGIIFWPALSYKIP